MSTTEIHTGLYSYPKSGNTWLRAIIAAGFDMPGGKPAMSTYLPDTANQEIGETPFNAKGIDWYFYKSHAMEVLDEHNGKPVRTDKVLYIYRHPLDVFMSFLNFQSDNVTGNAGKQMGISYESVEALTKQQFEMLYSRFVGFGTLIPQNKKFGSLFTSYRSFRDRQAAGEPVHFIKYEALKEDFAGEGKKIFDFLGFDPGDMEAVHQRADEYTQTDGKFFWKRKKDNYKDYLSDEQIARFNFVYEDELKELGYL